MLGHNNDNENNNEQNNCKNDKNECLTGGGGLNCGGAGGNSQAASLQYSVFSVILSNTQHSQEYSVMISILTANNKAGSMLPPTFMLDFHHKAEHNQQYKSLSFLYSHWGQLKT